VSAPCTPAVLYAEHQLPSGEVVSLALVRTRWSTEGQAVVERTDAEGAIDMIEHLAWFVRHTDTGPATLGLDDASKALKHELTDATLDLLLAKLVEAGDSWGLEAAEVYS